MRLFAPPDIEAQKETRDIKHLCKALHDRHVEVRRDAAVALGELAEYLAFPEEESDDSFRWDQLWAVGDGAFGRYAWPRLWLADVLEEDEQLLASEPVRLSRLGTVEKHLVGGYWETTYTFQWPLGRRASLIRGATAKGPEWPELSLCLTSARLLVTRLPQWWGFGLAEVRGIKSEGICDVARVDENDMYVGTIPSGAGIPHLSATRMLLAVDFTDGESVRFVGGSPSRALFESSALTPQQRLEQWIARCNTYLDLVHAGDARVEQYVKTARAYSHGGGLAAEALIKALEDKDEEVRTLALRALQSIGGPAAKVALAQLSAV